MTKLLRQRWIPARPPLDVNFVLNTKSKQADGLQAWWPFMASRGTNTLRDQARSYDGTFVNDPTWTADREMGAALQFASATSEYVNVGDVDLINGWSQLTITAWHYTDAIDKTTWPVVRYKNDNERVGLFYGVDQRTYVMVSNGGVDYGRVLLAFSGWHHDAMVFDGSQVGDANRLRLFRDGVPRLLTFFGGIPATCPNLSGENLYIGTYDLTNFSDSRVADIRIYNRALSPDEVWQLWAPETRWELYRPQRRQWTAGSPTVVGGAPVKGWGWGWQGA